MPESNRRSMRPPSPSRLKHLAALPTGPKWLQLRKDPDVVGGPGDPPPGFVTSSTSKSEWIFYWAAAKVTGSPKDPRVPNANGFYEGGDTWRYQKPYGDGRGASIIDFVFYTVNGVIAVRIQTFAFHFKVNAFKQATDMLQAQYLGRFFKVIDVQESDLLRDKTGESAILTVKATIKGEVALPPLNAGTVTEVRT